ncbi:MAG: PEP-CTERM sorting domain-containing protein [Phycisphaerales bacterium]|nr:PEP-CTERM sorting domain-containing protein [Phycisphaerales bacterium]
MSMKRSVFASLVVCGFAVGAAQGAVITLRSGDTTGAAGTPDPNVTVLPGPAGTGFTSLTPTDFTDAQITPAVIAPPNGFWIFTLPADPDARWITTGIGGTDEPSGLYAIHFFNPGFPEANLDLFYMVDDYLGAVSGSTVLTASVYLNGEPLTATNGDIAGTGDFLQQHELQFVDMPLLPGENWLYLNVTNTIGLSGVIFSGTLTLVPEPASLSLLGIGALGLLQRRKR